MEGNLVSIKNYDLLGSNFYWNKYAVHGLTKEDILEAGIVDDQVYVSEEIIPALLAVDKELQKNGWRLYVKEGYRSPAVYEIVYKRRVAKYGKEATDRLINMNDMPHASGKTVDVAIWDAVQNIEVWQRGAEEGIENLFINFYRNSETLEGKRFQELQDYLIGLMQENGFRLGSKGEYFHFDFKPETEANYC
jgi:D-alanyl-D-alanine dipeptidase